MCWSLRGFNEFYHDKQLKKEKKRVWAKSKIFKGVLLAKMPWYIYHEHAFIVQQGPFDTSS